MTALIGLLRPVCRLIGHRLDATRWEPGRNGYSPGYKRTVFCRRCGGSQYEFARQSCKPLDIIGGRALAPPSPETTDGKEAGE